MISTCSPRTLLIVWHSRTGAARQMAESAADAARDVIRTLQADHVQVVLMPASQCQPDDLLQADGYLFCAPENLASLSGEMKECFDRNYYAVLDRLNGRPYALMVSAGTDGSGAVRQAQRICTGWRLRAVAEPLIVLTGAQTPDAILAPKQLAPQALAGCQELGGTLAALLA